MQRIHNVFSVIRWIACQFLCFARLGRSCSTCARLGFSHVGVVRWWEAVLWACIWLSVGGCASGAALMQEADQSLKQLQQMVPLVGTSGVLRDAFSKYAKACELGVEQACRMAVKVWGTRVHELGLDGSTLAPNKMVWNDDDDAVALRCFRRYAYQRFEKVRGSGGVQAAVAFHKAFPFGPYRDEVAEIIEAGIARRLWFGAEYEKVAVPLVGDELGRQSKERVGAVRCLLGESSRCELQAARNYLRAYDKQLAGFGLDAHCPLQAMRERYGKGAARALGSLLRTNDVAELKPIVSGVLRVKGLTKSVPLDPRCKRKLVQQLIKVTTRQAVVAKSKDIVSECGHETRPQLSHAMCGARFGVRAGRRQDVAVCQRACRRAGVAKLHELADSHAQRCFMRWKQERGRKRRADALSREECTTVAEQRARAVKIKPRPRKNVFYQRSPPATVTLQLERESRRVFAEGCLRQCRTLASAHERQDNVAWGATDTESCEKAKTIDACNSVKSYLVRYPQGNFRADAAGILQRSAPAIRRLIEAKRRAEREKERAEKEAQRRRDREAAAEARREALAEARCNRSRRCRRERARRAYEREQEERRRNAGCCYYSCNFSHRSGNGSRISARYQMDTRSECERSARRHCKSFSDFEDAETAFTQGVACPKVF